MRRMPASTPSTALFSRLRFSQLEMVCALAEYGSLHAASEHLHQCVPALSKGLREIERVVGQALFARSPRGLTTTVAGQSFVREAHAVLNQVGRLRGALERRAGRRPAPLSLGCAASLAWCALPGALAALQGDGQAMPHVNLVEGRVLHLVERLLMGDLDAVLTIATPESIEALDDPALVVEQVHRESNVIVAAPAWPVVRRRAAWRSLRALPWILPPPSFIQRRIVQQAFLEAGELPPEPAIESINMPAMLRFAEAGLGLTAVPGYAARAMLAGGTLRVVRTTPEVASVPIAYAYRRSASNPALLQRLRDVLRAQLTGE